MDTHLVVRCTTVTSTYSLRPSYTLLSLSNPQRCTVRVKTHKVYTKKLKKLKIKLIN